MMEMLWRNKPDEVNVDGDKMTMLAGRGTNLFNDPSGEWKDNTFPYDYANIQGDFMALC